MTKREIVQHLEQAQCDAIEIEEIEEISKHLDIDCERRVNAAVQSLRMTRIIIAHRPETIASADRVLRLERGRIANPH